ncbi:MAG: GtrA family protein [Solirubrobacteraceae bacterium]|jgi:putative flippase GtrA
MNALLARLRSDPEILEQLVKYGIIGVGNTLLGFGLYALGVELDIPYGIALVFGYAVGGLNSYLLNRHWTFDAGALSHTRSGGRFFIVWASSVAVNFGVLYLLVHQFNIHSHTDKIITQAFLQTIVTLATFFVNRNWAFAGDPEPAAASEPASR